MSGPSRLIVVGGGLAGCLTALAVVQRHPDLPLLLVEGADRLGGNHVWSFFGSDVARDDWHLVEPLISRRWDDYEVRFPQLNRRIAQPYHSIKSEQLDRVVRERLGPERIRLGTPVAAVEQGGITLGSGERIDGAVVDARGAGDLSGLELGWQKFLGVDFAFGSPHGVERPVVMDATVPQLGGYRFVYLLPFSETELLVEDTYYTDGPELAVDILRQRIGDFMTSAGLPPAQPVREETGVLPVAMGGDIERLLGAGGDAAKIGMRGGFFHPTTGYSLPDAVRIASLVARQERLDGAALRTTIQGEARRLWRRRGFYRMLNKMLFKAAVPHERYRVLQRFYRLSPALIGRFYGGRTTFADRLRILTGRPPVPVGAAIRALVGGRTR